MSVRGPLNSSEIPEAQQVGGVFNAQPPAPLDGQGCALQLDANGRLLVSSTGGGSASTDIFDSSGNVLNSNGAGALQVAVVSGGGSNPSVGTTGVPAPTSATEIGIIDGSGNLTGVSPTTPLPISATAAANASGNPIFTESVGTSTVEVAGIIGTSTVTIAGGVAASITGTATVEVAGILGTSTVEVAGIVGTSTVTVAGGVAASITGTATVEVAGILGTSTVEVAGIVGTSTVTVAGGIAVSITGTATVEVAGILGTSTVEVAGIVGTSTVTVAGTITAACTGTQTVTVAGGVAASITGTATVEVAGILGTSTVEVAGIVGTSTVTISGGVAASITGTATVEVAGILGTSTVTVAGTVPISFPASPIVWIEGHTGAILDGATGATAPANSLQVGGWDGTDIRTLFTDNLGGLKLSAINIGFPDAASNTQSLLFSDTGGVAALTYNYSFNGTTWDRNRSAVVGNNVAATGLPIVEAYGQYNASLPTITTGNYTSLQTDVNGRLITTGVSAASITGTATVEVAGIVGTSTVTVAGGIAASITGTATVEVAGILGTSTVEVAGIVGTSTVTVAGTVTVVGDAATGATAAGNPVLVAGVDNTASTNLARRLGVDSGGAISVGSSVNGPADGTANTNNFNFFDALHGASTAYPLAICNMPLIFNGTTWDRVRSGAVTGATMVQVTSTPTVVVTGTSTVMVAGAFVAETKTQTVTSSATLAVAASTRWNLKAINFRAIISNTVTKQAAIWVTDNSGNVIWQGQGPVITPTNTLCYEHILYPAVTSQTTYVASALGSNTQAIVLSMPELVLGASYQINASMVGAASTQTYTLCANVIVE